MKENNSAYLKAAKEALVHWDLEVSHIELASQSENIVFRLDARSDRIDSVGTYALRLHRPGYHTLRELNAEQAWTTALNDAGLGVPVPRKTRDGHGYVSVPILDSSETRYVGVVEWLEGEPLRERITPDSDDIDKLSFYFKQIGQIAARIHNQAVNWPIPAGFQRHAFDADGLMGDAPFWGPFWNLPQMTDAQQRRIQSARNAIHRILSGYDKEQGTYSLIHSDLHPGNILVNGDQLHVIDFDDSGFGWHQYELAVALYHYQEHPRFAQIQEALIKGYRSVRPLTDAQIELIPLFLLIRALASLGWTYARPELNISDRIPSLVERVCKQIKANGLL